jgi:hypothetical protein
LYLDGVLEREAAVQTECGLYLLRYASGAISGASPIAKVRPAPGSESFIEIISAPGIVTGFLSFPGECVVVRAQRAGELIISIMRQSVGASMDAVFRLEPVSGVQRAGAGVALEASSPNAISPSFTGGDVKFSLLAHVSRRGDVDVGAGEWVAGPKAPAVIEGLEIRGSTNPGVGLELQPQVATTPPRWLDWVAPGKFAGTRGRGLALAGIRARLVGAEASRFVLSAEALFLGSAVQSKSGREIELVGSPGGDPLVGLRLDVVAAVEDGVPAKAATVQQRPESRVRVFRAVSSS